MNLSDLKDQGIIVMIALYLLQQIWQTFVGSARKKLKALENNTLAITKLETRMEDLQKIIVELPKMKQDVAAAHEKIRHIQKSLNQ